MPVHRPRRATGGQPYSVFGILDTMKQVKPDIQTYAMGACYSYASMLLVGRAGGARTWRTQFDRQPWRTGYEREAWQSRLDRDVILSRSYLIKTPCS